MFQMYSITNKWLSWKEMLFFSNSRCNRAFIKICFLAYFMLKGESIQWFLPLLDFDHIVVNIYKGKVDPLVWSTTNLTLT